MPEIQAVARYAVIGEPTGLVPVRLHKGIFMESVKVHGMSGHSTSRVTVMLFDISVIAFEINVLTGEGL